MSRAFNGVWLLVVFHLTNLCELDQNSCYQDYVLLIVCHQSQFCQACRHVCLKCKGYYSCRPRNGYYILAVNRKMNEIYLSFFDELILAIMALDWPLVATFAKRYSFNDLKLIVNLCILYSQCTQA